MWRYVAARRRQTDGRMDAGHTRERCPSHAHRPLQNVGSSHIQETPLGHLRVEASPKTRQVSWLRPLTQQRNEIIMMTILGVADRSHLGKIFKVAGWHVAPRLHLMTTFHVLNTEWPTHNWVFPHQLLRKWVCIRHHREDRERGREVRRQSRITRTVEKKWRKPRSSTEIPCQVEYVHRITHNSSSFWYNDVECYLNQECKVKWMFL